MRVLSLLRLGAEAHDASKDEVRYTHLTTPLYTLKHTVGSGALGRSLAPGRSQHSEANRTSGRWFRGFRAFGGSGLGFRVLRCLGF